MAPAPVTEAQIYQHSAELLGIHETLLKDEVRNRAFSRALESHVNENSAVLDIGSGTGLWAILAAKLGARRVVAIERDGLMCGVIRTLCRENGVADRVEVIHGEAGNIELPREFDIVVSETVGHMIFDEDIVSVMIDARQRFLKPGGVLIPDQVALIAAPVRLEEPKAAWPAGIGLNYRSFQSLALHRPLPYLDKSALRFLADPCELVSSDLGLVESPPDLSGLSGSWELGGTAPDAVAVWVEMRLTDGITLSTLETPSWSATVYRIERFPDGSGRLDFHLELNTATHLWSCSFEGSVQRFSPAIATTRLALQQHADAGLAPHAFIHGGGPVFA